jgi:hypothetical protein
MRSRLWVAANGLMAIAFLFSILVQLNDPDPLRWIVIYALALVACGIELFGRGHWAFPAAVGVVAGVWAVSLTPRVLGQVPFFAMFGDWEMRDVGIELSREMYGLFAILIWMAVLVIAVTRRRAPRRDP